MHAEADGSPRAEPDESPDHRCTRSSRYSAQMLRVDETRKLPTMAAAPIRPPRSHSRIGSIGHGWTTGVVIRATAPAASSNRPEVVRALLALGANPRLCTQDDFTALDMAASLECLTLLRAATRHAA